MLTYTKNITIKNNYNNELTDNNEFDEFSFDLDCASYKNILLCNISGDIKNIETFKPLHVSMKLRKTFRMKMKRKYHFKFNKRHSAKPLT